MKLDFETALVEWLKEEYRGTPIKINDAGDVFYIESLIDNSAHGRLILDELPKITVMGIGRPRILNMADPNFFEDLADMIRRMQYVYVCL
jgi:hypothetical protein